MVLWGSAEGGEKGGLNHDRGNLTANNAAGISTGGPVRHAWLSFLAAPCAALPAEACR